MSASYAPQRGLRAQALVDEKRQLVDALDAQQTRIARELHDGLGSNLAAASLMLGHFKTLLAQGAAPDAAPALTLALDNIAAQIQLASQMARDAARGLMPIGDFPGALWRALERLCTDAHRLPGIKCSYAVAGSWDNVPPSAAHHAYRIVQEAMTNALRAGGATRLELKLVQRGLRREITLQDNGAGIDWVAIDAARGTQNAGMGMASMRQRSQLMGAKLHWSAAPQGGTVVKLGWQDPPAAQA